MSGLFLADNQGSTKTLHYTTDGATTTQITSSTSRRFEDIACDSQTFAPQTVIWVEPSPAVQNRRDVPIEA